MENKTLTKKSYVQFYNRTNGTRGCRTINEDPSQTNPDGAEQADINNIVREYGRTGFWPVSTKQGIYLGEDSIPSPASLIEAHQLINNAREKFEELPSKIRERFNNDPIQLHNFLSNKSNLDEAVKLGLITVTKPNDDNSNDDEKASNKKKVHQN